MLDNPGFAHAIDAAGTEDGDPWRGEVVPGDVHFYGGPMSSGPFAACGIARVRAVLGDESVPVDDPYIAGQCARCAAAVNEGKGFRTPPSDPYGVEVMPEETKRLVLAVRLPKGWPTLAETSGSGRATGQDRPRVRVDASRRTGWGTVS